MIQFQELEKFFHKHSGEIASVEVTYPNGGIVRGTVKKLKSSPLKLIVEKDAEATKKLKKHKVVFDHITSLKTVLIDGSINEFK